MENNIKISYPDSEKVYLHGKIYPDIRVGVRRINLTPTIKMEKGKRVEKPNEPLLVYDTSGPYSDPEIDIDLRRGIPRMRESWIEGNETQ